MHRSARLGFAHLAGLAALLLAATVAPAIAQEVDRIDRITGSVGPGGSFRAPEGVKVVTPGALLFATFDGNLDGAVTREELAEGALRAFRSADRNSDGLITGFEQTDWAGLMADATGVLANAMTFDIDLDRTVTQAEFTSGLRRIADQLADEAGVLRFTDLVQPLNRSQDQARADAGVGWGGLTGRGSPPGGGRTQ
jgi:hypothetical protein